MYDNKHVYALTNKSERTGAISHRNIAFLVKAGTMGVEGLSGMEWCYQSDCKFCAKNNIYIRLWGVTQAQAATMAA